MEPGIIYLVFDGEWYKLGRTKNLKNRLQNYRANGYRMTLVHSFFVPDMRVWEHFFRYEFRGYLADGNEWFDLTESEVRWFQQMPETVDFYPTDEKLTEILLPDRYDRMDQLVENPMHNFKDGYWSRIRNLTRSNPLRFCFTFAKRQRRAMGGNDE